jgi:hypothetical protein
MLADKINTKKIAFLILGLFICLSLFSAQAKATDLNSKHDLCTGANLSVQATGAGCGKVYDPNTGNYVDESKDQNADSTFSRLTTDALNLISILAGLVTVFMVIYGGFRFLTSAGNPESTKAGRNAILYAFIGLIIVAFAQILVKFVINKIA